MSLSPEMIRYITTGQCPYCGVAILSVEYVSRNSELLRREADELASGYGGNRHFRRAMGLYDLDGLVPRGVSAEVTSYNHMKCLTCQRIWTPSVSSADQRAADQQAARGPRQLGARQPAGRADLSKQLPSRSQYLKEPRLFQPETPAPEPQFDSSPLDFPPSSTQIDLSRCRLLGVTGERKTVKLLHVDRKTYRNDSAATLTTKVAVTSSVELTVTIDSTKLKSYGEEAGIALVGFANIQGRIQRQLSERYEIAFQSTSSVSGEDSVEVPPYWAVEHIIQWKMVTWEGTALLGKARLPEPAAQVPYEVPFRLDYGSKVVDAPDVPVKKKKKRS